MILTIVTPQLSSCYNWLIAAKIGNSYNRNRLGGSLILSDFGEGELWETSFSK